MKTAVALAMLHRDEQWLLQLRDDVETIIHPGYWGLFGGHLEPGETAEEAVQRELEEEISWSPSAPLKPWFSDASGTRVVHVFRGALTVPTTDLHLKEGQDLRLVSFESCAAVRSGVITAAKQDQSHPDYRSSLPVC